MLMSPEVDQPSETGLMDSPMPRLPREIRDEICGLLLVESYPIEVCRERREWLELQGDTVCNLDVLCVNKQISIEAQSIMYHEILCFMDWPLRP